MGLLKFLLGMEHSPYILFRALLPHNGPRVLFRNSDGNKTPILKPTVASRLIIEQISSLKFQVRMLGMSLPTP